MARLPRPIGAIGLGTRTVYVGRPYGPIEIERSPDRVRVTGPGGTRVVVSAPYGERRAIRELLAGGLDVVLHDPVDPGELQVVGTLRQRRYGWRPSRRTITYEPTEPGGYPDGLEFRVRGAITNHVTLEHRGGPLIRVPRPHSWQLWRRVTIADGVPPELVLVHAAVADRLLSAVRI